VTAVRLDRAKHGRDEPVVERREAVALHRCRRHGRGGWLHREHFGDDIVDRQQPNAIVRT
jgi:hypothetical protein